MNNQEQNKDGFRANVYLDKEAIRKLKMKYLEQGHYTWSFSAWVREKVEEELK